MLHDLLFIILYHGYIEKGIKYNEKYQLSQISGQKSRTSVFAIDALGFILLYSFDTINKIFSRKTLRNLSKLVSALLSSYISNTF